jgi:hypothetical protein
MDTLKIEIDKIVSRANLNTKKETATPYHGSNAGETVEYTLYWDVYRCEWTYESRAIQGFVFNEINKLIQLS